MPRVSEQSQALQAIESTIEWVYALASSSEEEDELEEDLEELLTTYVLMRSLHPLAI